MKKFISILVAVVMLLSVVTAFADSYENNVYTFTAVNTTATFDVKGESISIDNEAVLRFDEKQVHMSLDGDADSVILCDIILTKYDNSEITYTLSDTSIVNAVIFGNGNFEDVDISQGAYLLILSTVEERGSAVIILVGEQTVVPEGTVPEPSKNVFGENAVLSDWAIPEVTEAYDNSLVTIELYRSADYKRNITRGEFAHIMAQVLVQCGVNYDAFVAELGDNPTFKFTDTNQDLEIEFVSHCGIINGITANEFSPDSVLTREQAATMLARTVTFLGTKPNIDTNIAPFVDEADFSDWSKSGIYTVAGLHDKVNGLAVMGGMGEGIFSPKTGYTVEQALIAAKRLLRAIK